MLGVLAVYFAAAAGMGGLELDLSGIEGLADAAPVALPPPPPLPPPEADECALWGGAVGGAAVAAGAGLYRCSYKRARCFGWHHSEAGFCNGEAAAPTTTRCCDVAPGRPLLTFGSP